MSWSDNVWRIQNTESLECLTIREISNAVKLVKLRRHTN